MPFSLPQYLNPKTSPTDRMENRPCYCTLKYFYSYSAHHEHNQKPQLQNSCSPTYGKALCTAHQKKSTASEIFSVLRLTFIVLLHNEDRDHYAHLSGHQLDVIIFHFAICYVNKRQHMTHHLPVSGQKPYVLSRS